MIETAEGIYAAAIESTLRKIFPDPFFFENLKEDAQKQFDIELPIFRWYWKKGHLSLYLVCRHRLNIGKFFYDMIHRWLLPGQRLDVAMFFSSDFKFLESPNLYTWAEMSIRLDHEIDREHVEHNLRVIETEIRLGMVSVYHASRLLEMHLLSTQEKNGILQEKISKLIQRNPDEIDYDIFGELQHFTVMSKEEFKTPRSPHHLSRLVALFYLFRKSIQRQQEKRPDKRHIRLKLANVQLDLPWGFKKVLGVCIALNFLRPNELFEEKHLIRALQNGIAGIKAVPDSFYVNEGSDDAIHTLYLEIEKETQEAFTADELQHLRKFLPEEVKRTVEVPLNSLFMPRNEEEVIRHVVSLSGQLRFVKDLPQVILIFDEQKEGDLYFTVLLVRILYPHSSSIQTLFNREDSRMTYIPDRVKRVGMLRKRYPKEATIFRLKFSSQPFLRDDRSVDLFRARQAIIQELQRLVGEVRDYNGGMIAKQIELLKTLQQLLGEADRVSNRLLESFFHSLYPIEARSIAAPEQLKTLFLLWKQLLVDQTQKILIQQDEVAIYVIARIGHLPEIDPANFNEMQLMSVRPELEERFLGYIFVSQDLVQRENFLENIPSVSADVLA
jgi:predicted HTH domain antitoxin